MIIPWCSSEVCRLRMVLSCPPCWVAVLVKTLPTLPMRAPRAHKPPV